MEENTFTRKMTDASIHEKKLMKKLEIAYKENEDLTMLLKKSETRSK